MGDISQSRYSIVERLTTQKLQIMDEKQQIEGNIESKKIHIKQYEQDLYQAKKDSEEELKNTTNSIHQQINRLQQEISSCEKGKASKSKLCDEKIREMDKALIALQEISKSSAEEAKQ